MLMRMNAMGGATLVQPIFDAGPRRHAEFCSHLRCSVTLHISLVYDQTSCCKHHITTWAATMRPRQPWVVHTCSAMPAHAEQGRSVRTTL